MSLLPQIQINLDVGDIETKLFDAEREEEKDSIGELSKSISRSTSTDDTDRSNEAGTNDEFKKVKEHSGGSLSPSGEHSFKNKATDGLRQDDHLQSLFPTEVKEDEMDPDDETTGKAPSDVNSLENKFLGNNAENDSRSQDDLLPPFPLLEVDDEEANEITSNANDVQKIEEDLHQIGFEDEVKAVSGEENGEVDENNLAPIFEQDDPGQTRAKNESDQTTCETDWCQSDITDIALYNETDGEDVMNTSEGREENFPDIVDENESESVTTELLPIFTLGFEDEEEMAKNDSSDSSIPLTGSGSVSSEEGNGLEPEMEEEGEGGDVGPGQRSSDVVDLSQEFLSDDSLDNSTFNTSLGEDEEEADSGYLLPMFQIEEESGTLIVTDQEVLFLESEQTEENATEEEELFSSFSNISVASEEGGKGGIIKAKQETGGEKPDSHEVGVEVEIDVGVAEKEVEIDLAVTENDLLALQDSEEGHQLLEGPADEEDDNKEEDGSELQNISPGTPVLNKENMESSANIKEDERHSTVSSSESFVGLESDKILDAGMNSRDKLDQSVFLDIQNIDRQGERHSGKSQGTSYMLPEIKIGNIGENSSLEDSYEDSYVTDEDYILSEESFGDSFQNPHGSELAIDEVDNNYESGKEKEEDSFAGESLGPKLKSLPPTETHLSSGWRQVEKETKVETKVEKETNDDEESKDQDDRGSEERSQETGVDSLPQNYRRPCIPHFGNDGVQRIATPFLFPFAWAVLAWR